MTTAVRNALVVLLLFCAVLGLVAMLASGWFALQDWSALQAADAHLQSLAAGGAELRDLFVAEARQNIHRVNLFAEGVWSLLGAVLFSLGLTGLAVLHRPAPETRAS